MSRRVWQFTSIWGSKITVSGWSSPNVQDTSVQANQCCRILYLTTCEWRTHQNRILNVERHWIHRKWIRRELTSRNPSVMTHMKKSKMHVHKLWKIKLFCTYCELLSQLWVSMRTVCGRRDENSLWFLSVALKVLMVLRVKPVLCSHAMNPVS